MLCDPKFYTQTSVNTDVVVRPTVLRRTEKAIRTNESQFYFNSDVLELTTKLQDFFDDDPHTAEY
jgi:hypothetical protein